MLTLLKVLSAAAFVLVCSGAIGGVEASSSCNVQKRGTSNGKATLFQVNCQTAQLI